MGEGRNKFGFKQSPLDLMGPREIEEVRVQSALNLKFLFPMFSEHEREVMAVVTLDSDFHTTSLDVLGSGSEDSISFTPRDLFRTAISTDAAYLILFHNHPNEADLQPSEKDKNLTANVQEMGKVMFIPILDHIIIGKGNTWLSMRSEGLMGLKPKSKYPTHSQAAKSEKSLLLSIDGKSMISIHHQR